MEIIVTHKEKTANLTEREFEKNGPSASLRGQSAEFRGYSDKMLAVRLSRLDRPPFDSAQGANREDMDE